jgi:hypothetical protein
MTANIHCSFQDQTCQISQIQAEQHFRKTLSFRPHNNNNNNNNKGDSYTIELVTLWQRGIKPQHQVAPANTFCWVAPNTCGSSKWSLFHVTILASRILRFLLDFWKSFAPLLLGCVCFDWWPPIGFSYIVNYYFQRVNLSLWFPKFFFPLRLETVSAILCYCDC